MAVVLLTLFGFPSGSVLVLACQRPPTPHVQPPDQDVEVHGQSSATCGDDA